MYHHAKTKQKKYDYNLSEFLVLIIEFDYISEDQESFDKF